MQHGQALSIQHLEPALPADQTNQEKISQSKASGQGKCKVLRSRHRCEGHTSELWLGWLTIGLPCVQHSGHHKSHDFAPGGQQFCQNEAGNGCDGWNLPASSDLGIGSHQGIHELFMNLNCPVSQPQLLTTWYANACSSWFIPTSNKAWWAHPAKLMFNAAQWEWESEGRHARIKPSYNHASSRIGIIA